MPAAVDNDVAGLQMRCQGLEFLVEWLHPVFEHVPEIRTPSFNEGVALSAASVAVGLVGMAIAFVVYRRGLDSSAADPAIERLGTVGRVFGHAYYFDDGVARLVGGPLRRGATWLANTFDAKVIDGAVTGVGELVRRGSGGLRRVQSGRVRSYAVWIVIGAAGILLYLLIAAGR